MTKRKLDRNPNAGKKHPHSWDPRRSTNYAHSNLKRMGKDSIVTSWIDPSVIVSGHKTYTLANDPSFR